METEIKVSIICNAFNHGKYIRDALEGFVSQKTDFPFEVLVHDDASTDNTAEIIREYEEKYPDIIKPIYQTENKYSKGIKINRTYQTPRIKGKYVAVCEGDDYWTDPLKLQKQCDFLDNNPEYSMCVCSTSWLNMLTGRRENRGKCEEDRDISLDEIILEKNGRIYQYATIVVKTSVWNQYPEWRTIIPIGDLTLSIMAALDGKVRMLKDNMAVYRYYSAGSWTARMDSDKHREKISLKMIEGLECLNNYTEYKYDSVIKQRINKHKYTLALMQHDLKALKSEELQSIYKSRSLALRMSDLWRCKFPKLYTAVRKVSKRIVK